MDTHLSVGYSPVVTRAIRVGCKNATLQGRVIEAHDIYLGGYFDRKIGVGVHHFALQRGRVSCGYRGGVNNH